MLTKKNQTTTKRTEQSQTMGINASKMANALSEEKVPGTTTECDGSKDCGILKRMLAYEFSEAGLVHLETT